MIPLLFSRLLAMGLAAGWIVLPICLLRFLLRKFPKKYSACLWGLVAIRLLCPLSVHSAISLVPEQTCWIAPAAGVGPWGALWLLGVGVMLSGGMVRCIRLRPILREAVQVEKGVWRCDNIPTSFVLGIFRPKIFLSSELNAGAAELVLAHEKAHIRRGDPLWKGTGFLLLCVYWYHPLLWLAYFLFCRDVEIACDQSVAANLSQRQRRRYAEVLLQCAAAASPGFPSVGFGGKHMEARIRAVLEYHRSSKCGVSAAILVIILAAACLLTDGYPATGVYDDAVITAASQLISELHTIATTD